jgi:hypothetical protein
MPNAQISVFACRAISSHLRKFHLFLSNASWDYDRLSEGEHSRDKYGPPHQRLWGQKIRWTDGHNMQNHLQVKKISPSKR